MDYGGIATATRTGARPDGRLLAPPMPVASFKNLTQSDAMAIAAYLKTLPPIKNKVPGPFGANEKPTSFCLSSAFAEQVHAHSASGGAWKVTRVSTNDFKKRHRPALLFGAR